MLGEIAITPDVFTETGHRSPEAAHAYLQMLKEPLLEEVLVRDLWAGDWRRSLSEIPCSPMGKEVLKKLTRDGRLREVPPFGQASPVTDEGWCSEALASCKEPGGKLDCILTTDSTKQRFGNETLVTNLERVSSHPWWQRRSSSIEVRRSSDEYALHLDRILKCANSFMFIDPHLDPTEYRYSQFCRLLKMAERTSVQPRIEIHRVCYKGGGAQREIVKDWQSRFETALRPKMAGSPLHINVYIWDDCHERYLITNIFSIHLGNGFDVDQSKTTWSRLGKGQRDNLQREFDEASGQHTLREKFTITFQ
ncbi:MAG: hypothetical protein KJ052_00280 [Candidatus Hydrogenedentes bacterium]|nr:hypothetical protein [Candidatus Hydrogenedentota bacterium]